MECQQLYGLRFESYCILFDLSAKLQYRDYSLIDSSTWANFDQTPKYLFNKQLN